MDIFIREKKIAFNIPYSFSCFSLWCYWSLLRVSNFLVTFKYFRYQKFLGVLSTPDLVLSNKTFSVMVQSSVLNSCPFSRWCHRTIPSSVIPFFSFPKSFPASGSFPMSQFFPSSGQSIGVSASASILYYICMEGVPDLPVAPQDEAGLTKTFQTWPRGWFHIP